MSKPVLVVAQLLLMAASFGVPSQAVDEEQLKKDLTAVIALHGLPCGQVVQVTVLAENDYAALCQDTNRYRVYLNAAGRVVIEKLE